MKEHHASTEEVLELIKPYYEHLGKPTNEAKGDTSHGLSPETKTTITQRGVTIPLTLQPTEGGDPAKIFALIDSGAMICCINIDFTRRTKWSLEKLQQPTLARNADGSSNAGGLIWHKIQLTLRIHDRSLKQDFLATRLGQEEKVILGHPWLTAYNPTIDWVTGKVVLEGDTPPHSPTRLPTPRR